MLNSEKGNLDDLLRDGATIIDVRSEREFAAGNYLTQ
jgi:rhodanese-related sulfurtransferase